MSREFLIKGLFKKMCVQGNHETCRNEVKRLLVAAQVLPPLGLKGQEEEQLPDPEGKD